MLVANSFLLKRVGLKNWMNVLYLARLDPIFLVGASSADGWGDGRIGLGVLKKPSLP